MTALADRNAVQLVDVEIVVPVHNEELDLGPSVRRLHGFVNDGFPFRALITIADNASTDRTWDIARQLADDLAGVRAVHLETKGRGRAVQQVWASSTARVVAYMDVDLSTDLAALLPLVAPLLSGHSDVAIGTRLARSARVVRGPKREVISRCYNLLLRTALHAGFSDAQCGFKAMRVEAARALLPGVKDTAWFFDTELLVLAERNGMRIAEVPVDWVDDPDSRVDIVATALADLRGVARLMASGQILRFATIGVLSTLAYLLLYALARPVLAAQPANLLALLSTAIGNTAANRRFTFGVRGAGAARHQTRGLVVFGLALAITSGSLWLLAQASAQPPRAVELAVLVFANLLATALRFVLLRNWVFRPKEANR